MSLGYFDAKRYVYGLKGEYYYLERTMDEKQAYDALMRLIEDYVVHIDPNASLRKIHEEIIPKFAQKHDAQGDYYDLLIKYVEHTGAAFKIPEFRIISDAQLISEVSAAMAERGMLQRTSVWG